MMLTIIPLSSMVRNRPPAGGIVLRLFGMLSYGFGKTYPSLDYLWKHASSWGVILGEPETMLRCSEKKPGRMKTRRNADPDPPPMIFAPDPTRPEILHPAFSPPYKSPRTTVSILDPLNSHPTLAFSWPRSGKHVLASYGFSCVKNLGTGPREARALGIMGGINMKLRNKSLTEKDDRQYVMGKG